MQERERGREREREREREKEREAKQTGRKKTGACPSPRGERERNLGFTVV